MNLKHNCVESQKCPPVIKVIYIMLKLLLLLTKLTEASKSQKIDSKFSTKTKTFQNLNMPPP